MAVVELDVLTHRIGKTKGGSLKASMITLLGDQTQRTMGGNPLRSKFLCFLRWTFRLAELGNGMNVYQYCRILHQMIEKENLQNIK